MGDKFHIEQNELVKFVGEINHRLFQYIEFIEELKAAFNSVCRTEGFEGTKANAAKEYFSLYYGDTELSIPELIKGAAYGISDALYILEFKYDEFDHPEENFVVDEETLDEEISLINGIRSEKFDEIHQSVINTINSVSDLISLSSPNPSVYEDTSSSLVEKITDIKNKVYGIEEEILIYVNQLSEQVDSLITLVESHTNKEKRVESYESSEEIITRELQDALEKYYIGNQTRALNAEIVAIGQQYHENSVERLKWEAADKRLEEGFDKFLNGLMATGVGLGCLIASGGTAFPVLAGLGYLSGTGSMLYGTSNMVEGVEIEIYGVNGDITSASHNLFRDYVFDGDQELYDIVGGSCVKLSSLVMIVSPYTQSLSATNISPRVAVAKASVFSSGMIASEFSSYGIEEFCKKKGFDPYTTMLLQGAAYVGTLGTICKIGNFIVDGVALKVANADTTKKVVDQKAISSEPVEDLNYSDFADGMSEADKARYIQNNETKFFEEFSERAQKAGLNDVQISEAYDAMKNGKYAKMASYFDTSSPNDGAVFWSGNKEAAAAYAKSKGGTILEQTPGGRVFDEWRGLQGMYPEWDTGPTPQKGIWKALSSQYARGAKGNVTYVHAEGYVGKMWLDIEQPVVSYNNRSSRGIVSSISEVIVDGK